MSGREWSGDPLSAKEAARARYARIKALYLRGSQEQLTDVDQGWGAPSDTVLQSHWAGGRENGDEEGLYVPGPVVQLMSVGGIAMGLPGAAVICAVFLVWAVN